jgi:hypothetical protein
MKNIYKGHNDPQTIPNTKPTRGLSILFYILKKFKIAPKIPDLLEVETR